VFIAMAAFRFLQPATRQPVLQRARALRLLAEQLQLLRLPGSKGSRGGFGSDSSLWDARPER